MYFQFPPKHAPITDRAKPFLEGDSCSINWFQWFQSLRDGLDGGTYTPVVGAVLNVAPVAAQSAQFLRVGNTVYVSGVTNQTNTVAGAGSFITLSLPVPTNITAVTNLAGTAVSVDAGLTEAARIVGVVATDVASIEWIAAGAGVGRSFWYHYGYRLL